MSITMCLGEDEDETKATATDIMVIMSGYTKDALLSGNEMITRLDILVALVVWAAPYPTHPCRDDSPRVRMPLIQSGQRRVAFTAN